MKSWNWVVQYSIAMILAVLLGTLLASFPLFRESALGHTRIRASNLVQFLGYGGALLLFWFAGRRASSQLQEDKKGLSTLHYVIMPLVSLVVLSGAYEVLLQVVGPFLGKTGKSIYNWLFIVGLASSALWLTVTWLRHSESLVATIRRMGVVDPPPRSSRTGH